MYIAAYRCAKKSARRTAQRARSAEFFPDRRDKMHEEINQNRRRFLGTLGLALAGVHFGALRSANAQFDELGDFPSLGGATGWLNSPPLTPGWTSREGCSRRLLDLLLHQLAAHLTLCQRMGEEVQRSGTGGDRCAHARVCSLRRTSITFAGR